MGILIISSSVRRVRHTLTRAGSHSDDSSAEITYGDVEECYCARTEDGEEDEEEEECARTKLCAR